MLRGRRYFLGAIPGLLYASPQETPSAPPSTPPPAEFRFFSGRVDEFTGESISVSRELASRKHETRTFVRTPDTVIKGNLKKGVKVTVAFTKVDDNYIAHRVMIRG